MLNVILTSVVMLNVVLLNVVAPNKLVENEKVEGFIFAFLSSYVETLSRVCTNKRFTSVIYECLQ